MATECPYCNLTKEELEKMSESEADKFVLEMDLDKICIDHTIKQLDIRKAYSLVGKDLIKAITEN